MVEKPKTVIVMKVGPHSDMSLSDIIISKKKEEVLHGVHYWGYSGVFCQPNRTQQFCEWAIETYGETPKLILIETKSSYNSDIGMITQYSENNRKFMHFKAPVQLQGAQFSFVARNLKTLNNFYLDDYIVVGGKNDGKPLSEHLRFRVNKSFAKIETGESNLETMNPKNIISVLEAELTYPYAIWLKD